MPTRIFDRYLWRQVASATLTGVLVLTGVMVLGNVFKEMERLLGDTSSIPLLAVLKFVGYVVPFSLTFTIPWALLTAILLVFGRMSADNEMTALRMTGMSMQRICCTVFIFAALLSGACYWVNSDVAPAAKSKIKRLFYDLALDDPAMLFQEGKILDKFPGYRIYTEKRVGNSLQNVEIIQTNKGVAQMYIRAKSAEIELQSGQDDFVLRLREGHIETSDGSEGISDKDTVIQDNIKPFYFAEHPLNFPLSKLKEKTERVTNSMKSMDTLWSEVRTGINSVNGEVMDEKTLSASRTELSMRYSFSLAAFVFTLVGIPLGITAQRRETSIGFALSLGVAVSYIFFIIFANTLNESPKLYPHLLMWLPNLVFLAIGGRLFYRLCTK